LDTLQVDFEIEPFMLARKHLGHPIRNLRLNYSPDILSEKVARFTR
jgi:hypothetical protein